MGVKKIPKVQAVELTLSVWLCDLQVSSLLHCIRYSSTMAPPMELLTPFNYHQWKEDMEMHFLSKRLYRIIMDTEVDPIHYVDKEKY